MRPLGRATVPGAYNEPLYGQLYVTIVTYELYALLSKKKSLYVNMLPSACPKQSEVKLHWGSE